MASDRGQVYYWVGCDAWRRLSRKNLRYFTAREDAERAGYTPSRTAGCAGPVDGSSEIPGQRAPADRTDSESAPRSASERPAGRASDRILPCTVSRVTDGDTFVCSGGRRVRLLLVDAPERAQGEEGRRATAVVARHAPPGTVVSLELDVQRTDRYGRTLAYVRLPDGALLNEVLLREGVAVVLVYPPNVQHVERFRAIADSARTEKRGLWATNGFECLPVDNRRGRCR